MSNIDFTEYDRITDTIMYLSDAMTLNFTVGLSRKGKAGERIFYQYESRYGSDKYGSPLRSIKRQMNYAFTIDCKDDFLAGMMLRPQDVELICRLIDMKVIPWFLNDQSVYKLIDNKLIITEFEPATYVQDSKWISFSPDIFVDTYTEQESRGIKIKLSSGFWSILSVDKFMGFYNILSKTDMYSVACALTNYVKTPPYGVNVYTNQGLGASINGTNNSIENKWKEAASSRGGFSKNSFLDGANYKKGSD